ncbi:hypothetical protein [Agromyces humi]|uniref:hypothetical protein n=1 Tax=Agromyces humi TaxID=1766800 RepID=UPI00135CABD0|nr:hypothetical protein [Agromyces humi]
MTDFSAVDEAIGQLDEATAETLLALRDDLELHEAVALALHPGWDGHSPAELQDGADTFRGIVDKLLAVRA